MVVLRLRVVGQQGELVIHKPPVVFYRGAVAEHHKTFCLGFQLLGKVYDLDARRDAARFECHDRIPYVVEPEGVCPHLVTVHAEGDGVVLVFQVSLLHAVHLFLSIGFRIHVSSQHHVVTYGVLVA